MRIALRSMMAVVLLSCVFAASSVAESLNDPNLRFSMTIPDGFQPDARLVGAQPDIVHAYRKAAPDGTDMIVLVKRMRGTIGREPLNPAHMPPTFKGTISRTRWNGFTIDLVEVPEEMNGVEVLTLNAQVPLKHEAIQIGVFGRRDQRTQLNALLDQLLGSLVGESNWLQSSAPAAIADAPRYGVVIATITVGGAIGALLVLWVFRRRSPRGTIIALSILIYACSWGIDTGRSREMAALVGGMRLFGFLGLILGVIDIFIKRPKPVQPPARKVDPGSLR